MNFQQKLINASRQFNLNQEDLLLKNKIRFQKSGQCSKCGHRPILSEHSRQWVLKVCTTQFEEMHRIMGYSLHGTPQAYRNLEGIKVEETECCESQS